MVILYIAGMVTLIGLAGLSVAFWAAAKTTPKENGTMLELIKDFSKLVKEGGKDLDDLKNAFHKIITSAKEKMDYCELSALYFYMARFALEEGKDTKPLIEKSRRYELLGIAEILGFNTEVKALPTADSCDGCKELVGETCTIGEALETMPIPRHCRKDICTCVYVASISDVREPPADHSGRAPKVSDTS